MSIPVDIAADIDATSALGFCCAAPNSTLNSSPPTAGAPSIAQLEGYKHRRIVESGDPLARAIISHYETWWKNGRVEGPEQWQKASSILFDTVAVHLAFCKQTLVMEDLPVCVTNEGFTIIEEGAPSIRCATKWKDYGGFEDLLVGRLTQNG
jgi:hypothetical protein